MQVDRFTNNPYRFASWTNPHGGLAIVIETHISVKSSSFWGFDDDS